MENEGCSWKNCSNSVRKFSKSTSNSIRILFCSNTACMSEHRGVRFIRVRHLFFSQKLCKIKIYTKSLSLLTCCKPECVHIQAKQFVFARRQEAVHKLLQFSVGRVEVLTSYGRNRRSSSRGFTSMGNPLRNRVRTCDRNKHTAKGVEICTSTTKTSDIGMTSTKFRRGQILRRKNNNHKAIKFIS